MLPGIIYGDLNYSSNQEFSISEANVAGEINFSKSGTSTENTFSLLKILPSIGATIATSVLLWLLFLWLTPKFVKNTNLIFTKKILPILGFGLLGLIVIPIIAIILLFINITATLSLLLLVIYFIIIALSSSIFIIAVNNLICDKLKISKNIGVFGMLITTSAIISLLSFVPY